MLHGDRIGEYVKKYQKKRGEGIRRILYARARMQSRRRTHIRRALERAQGGNKLQKHEKVTQTVDTHSVDKLSKILGTFDENLNVLSAELGVIAYVEGTKIRLEGEESAVALGMDVLQALLKVAESSDEIDKSRIVYCIELSWVYILLFYLTEL